ncbi:MAG: RNA methyltransferase [Muribaculaceae bacterium]|nr:RNA methyltransferase [Muribaculaceae bacterium]
MQIIEIEDIRDERVREYAGLTERELRRGEKGFSGLFIAESPKVIRVALASGCRPVSFLCERKHIEGDARDILEKTDVPVFTGERKVLEKLTGYVLTRGVLCAMERPVLPDVRDLCRDARRVAVIDGVCDTTNIGAIFRSAAALGMDAVLLTGGSCDPLNRRSVRVSMGSVFLVPWTWIDNPVETLRELGFATAAMALREDSVNITDEKLNGEKRLAVILGTEGDGLSNHIIEGCDYTVCIPMAHNVDSLNVAAASAVAFFQLSKNNDHP